jgi:hypothetical protein
MEIKGKFTLLAVTEFSTWLKQQTVTRKISFVQHHHTWNPSYKNFRGNNHFSLQESMRDFHLERGFSDIAQHFTTYPDGKICTGRSLNQIPAGIKGANTGAICIENLGNFDANGDIMNVEHRESIITVTAVLLKRFGINPDDNGVIYHHWYDLNTGKRTNGTGSTKTCPGTNFFGGNSVTIFNDNFIPPLLLALKSTKIKDESAGSKILQTGSVNSDNLNVRSGPSSKNNIVDVLHRTIEVNCYEVKENWWKIHPAKEQWVYSKYVTVSN